MINYGKQNLDSKEIKDVIKVLKTDFITQGNRINEFENILKKKFGAKFYRDQCSLPIYLDLNTKQQNFIIKKLIKFTN